MSIDKDIAQPKFRNEYQRAHINIIYTFNWLEERVRTIFDAHDVTPQQFNILRILRGAGQPISTLQIRQRMLDKMSDTSRIVDRLIKKGLAEKFTSKVDRRLVDVTISSKGLRLLKKTDTHENAMDDLLKGLSEEEAKTLSLLLDKIRQSAYKLHESTNLGKCKK
jgi:DNA-binding MarR family transcriptional regulator